MEYMQMKYYPKEVYYENRGGVNYIILDYGDNKVEHVIAAQQSVQPTIATAALEDSPFETGMRRNAVVLSNRNSG